uniref:Uncharacterized protein n=1 Tax=Rhizophora mucronata TaxID=61149 RepID=A0A2P2NKB4_RHIMU
MVDGEEMRTIGGKPSEVSVHKSLGLEKVHCP